MGVYDEVVFTTPCCEETIFEQSKSGPCYLQVYGSGNVPASIVAGLSERVFCPVCDKEYRINIHKKVKLKLKEVKDDD